MPTELTKLAKVPGPWGMFARNGSRLLCADGIIRAAELAPTADTFFSIPARVRVKGKWLSGYATSIGASGQTTDHSAGTVSQFCKHTNGINAALLPDWPRDSWSAESVSLLAKGVKADPAPVTPARHGQGMDSAELGAFLNEPRKPSTRDNPFGL